VKKRHTNYNTKMPKTFFHRNSMCVLLIKLLETKGGSKWTKKRTLQTFNISLGLACKKGMQCFVLWGLGHILVANNCGQWFDFCLWLEQREMWRKVHYYYCFFWVKEVLLFCVFIECIFVGRYCIGPNLTMGITWTWGMAKTKPYFHGDILVVHVFFNIYLSFFLKFFIEIYF